MNHANEVSKCYALQRGIVTPIASWQGQISIEAIVSFLFLVSFLAIGIGLLEKQKISVTGGNDSLEAEANAQECALIVNSLFSNTESSLKKFNANCYAEKEFEIKSLGEKEKSAFCIAKQVKTIRIGKETFLEVKTSEHYR